MRTGALAFFALALGGSTVFWMASLRWGGADPSDSWLFLAGGAGPCLAAVGLTQLCEAPETRRDFWLRIVDPRRIRGRWWLASLLLHPALVALAFATDLALGGPAPALPARAQTFPGLASLLCFVFWFGPLPEEMGWRGFALDRLRARMADLPASLLLGAVWALWHVPLFFVPGTFQAGLGAGSARSWVFLLSLLPLSVLMTWVYRNTARSTLSAVLVHFSGNLCGALFAKSDRVATLELAFLALAAALVGARGGLRSDRR